jgi:hypothetical protein
MDSREEKREFMVRYWKVTYRLWTMSSIPFSIPSTPLAVRYGKQAVQGKQNQASKSGFSNFALAEVFIHPANAISNAVFSFFL